MPARTMQGRTDCSGERARQPPRPPCPVALVGGANGVEQRIDLFMNLVKKVDALVIPSARRRAMGQPFHRSRGGRIVSGTSLCRSTNLAHSLTTDHDRCPPLRRCAIVLARKTGVVRPRENSRQGRAPAMKVVLRSMPHFHPPRWGPRTSARNPLKP